MLKLRIKKPADKGQVIYLMAGHRARDFKNPAYERLVLNLEEPAAEKIFEPRFL